MSFPRYPKYKDSGVEWLGEVPEHWDVDAARSYCLIKARLGEMPIEHVSDEESHDPADSE